MMISDLLQGGNCLPAITVGTDLPLLEAAAMLRDLDATALVVMSRSRLLGILSERDLVNSVAEKGASIALMTVGDSMNRALVTCTLADDVSEMLNRMSVEGVHHVLVVEEGVPVSVLTVREFEAACRILKEQADSDELTGLANRRSFLRTVDAELNRYRRHRTSLAVAMLDIDYFKKINDQLGHAEGDRILRKVAQTMAMGLRSFDHFARLGGDEFAIMFPETRLSEAVDACRRLISECAKHRLPKMDGMFCLNLSCGVTVANAGDKSAATILARADESLYRAKETGRGRVVAARTAVRDQFQSA